jgi:acyl carrier protein
MDKVFEVISMVLNVPVDENSSMDNVEAWDSFNHGLIMIELKSEFGLDVRQEEFDKLTSVKSIVNKLHEID